MIVRIVILDDNLTVAQKREMESAIHRRMENIEAAVMAVILRDLPGWDIRLEISEE